MRKSAIIILLIIFFMHPVSADAICPEDSALEDLISSICWECIFPIYIAGVEIDAGSHVNDITESEAEMECMCPTEEPPYVREGITISYWPVSYYVELVKDPYCFPSYGLDMSTDDESSNLRSLMKGGGGEIGNGNPETSTFMQAHFWYFYLMGMMDEELDTMCQEMTSTDLVGLSEIDPLWQDDELAAIIQLEAYLYANYAAQLTCIADAVSANIGYSISPLHWCVGSSGSLYPLTGHVNNDDLLQAYELVVGRSVFRMHRQAAICDGACWYCQCMYTPIWIKHHYRDQVAWPVNAGFCHAFGTTDIIWGPGKNPPDVRKMDNLIFLLYRKRTCCMSTP
ncbi:MAG: hypothetical protein CVU54_11980 [Deltaproteobacteria bacterium HGW-Deltaproteobacteria-12]|nr:MAG: hypothetical protein CVU54_11980 [Deltaproteobacteria bacterium HGW-Deltaproteobacteria-12]